MRNVSQKAARLLTLAALAVFACVLAGVTFGALGVTASSVVANNRMNQEVMLARDGLAGLALTAALLAALAAVQSGAVYAMPTAFEAWDSPVPSGVLGTLWLASRLHPEAYGEALYRDAAKALYGTYYGFTPDEGAL